MDREREREKRADPLEKVSIHPSIHQSINQSMMYNVGETRWGDYEVGVGDVDVHPRWPGTVQCLKRPVHTIGIHWECVQHRQRRLQLGSRCEPAFEGCVLLRDCEFFWGCNWPFVFGMGLFDVNKCHAYSLSHHLSEMRKPCRKPTQGWSC